MHLKIQVQINDDDLLVLENEITQICSHHLCVAGDFNSRIAKLNNFVSSDTYFNDFSLLMMKFSLI